MTEHLYYHDSFLDAFDAEVRELQHGTAKDLRPALILDRTAFYPTSGGQPFDTGWLIPDATSPNSELQKLRVTEVAEREDGQIVHYLEPAVAENKLTLQKGSRVRGLIDPARRRDHMQQHSGQHILSAAFVRLFNMSTVSFHMGDECCSIDLDAPLLTREQVESAERLSNEIIQENRPVEVRYATQDDAATLGLRKLPPAERDHLRLIDIRDFDLTACGGTHVRATGQVGCILLRKTEKPGRDGALGSSAASAPSPPPAATSPRSAMPPRCFRRVSGSCRNKFASPLTRSNPCANNSTSRENNLRLRSRSPCLLQQTNPMVAN